LRWPCSPYGGAKSAEQPWTLARLALCADYMVARTALKNFIEFVPELLQPVECRLQETTIGRSLVVRYDRT
jgi:hypothetical protein